MKTSILFGLMLLPFLCSSQVVDTAAVIRQVDSLIDISLTLRKQRNFDKALEVNAVAETLALEKLGAQSAAYGKCCFYHGRIVYFKGDLPEAEKWFLDAKGIRETVLGKEHPDYVWSLNYLADLYQRMGNNEKALQHFLEAVELGEKVFGEETSDYAIIISNLAYLYHGMGDLEKAVEFSLKAQAIFERTVGKEHPDYAINSNMLFNMYLAMGQYEKAETYILETRDCWEKVRGKESPEYARSLDNQAVIYAMMGLYEKAEPLYWEAKTIFEKTLGKESGDYQMCAYNLAMLLGAMGNYEKAEGLLWEMIHINETPGTISDGRNREQLAILYHKMGDYEKAEAFYKEVLAIKEASGKDASENWGTLANLALLYDELGDYEKAGPLFLQAQAGWEKLRKEHPIYAAHLENLAAFYHHTGNYEKAETLYHEVKTLRENIVGKEHPSFAWTLTGLGNLYKDLGNYEKAASLFEELVYLQQSLITRSIHHLSQRELVGYLSTFSKRQDQMLSFVQIADDKAARIHSVCYDNILFYKGFLLNTSNRIRWLALFDSTATEKYHLLKSYERLLAAEYAKPIAERKNVLKLEAKANDLEKELARDVTGFGEAMRQVRWQEVQQQLQATEAAVEFIHYQYYGKKQSDSIMYAALVLRPEDAAPQFIPLFEEREIALLLKGAKGNNFMQINALYAFQSEGEQESLYNLIWKPLKEHLQGVKTVYCSPSGLLHRINLGAIPVNKQQTFAEVHPLVLLNSTRQLVLLKAAEDAGNDGYIVGGVRYDAESSDLASADLTFASRGMAALDELPFHTDSTSRGSSWNYLPGTETEALDVSRVLQSASFDAHLDTAIHATEESFRSLGVDMPSPRILHIATHGFFFPDPKEVVSGRSRSESGAADSEPVFKISEHPMMRSGLILAGAQQAWTTGKAPENREDGILTAYEISQMNLSNTELVVLSACETGLGDIEGNEGVYGLQRAFKIAGAKYLMMSLWKVNDQSTRELMIDFYQQWLIKGMDIPEAFRTAQNNMKKKYPDAPYHWAGFVLME